MKENPLKKYVVIIHHESDEVLIMLSEEFKNDQYTLLHCECACDTDSDDDAIDNAIKTAAKFGYRFTGVDRQKIKSKLKCPVQLKHGAKIIKLDNSAAIYRAILNRGKDGKGDA